MLHHRISCDNNNNPSKSHLFDVVVNSLDYLTVPDCRVVLVTDCAASACRATQAFLLSVAILRFVVEFCFLSRPVLHWPRGLLRTTILSACAANLVKSWTSLIAKIVRTFSGSCSMNMDFKISSVICPTAKLRRRCRKMEGFSSPSSCEPRSLLILVVLVSPNTIQMRSFNFKYLSCGVDNHVGYKRQHGVRMQQYVAELGLVTYYSVDGKSRLKLGKP